MSEAIAIGIISFLTLVVIVGLIVTVFIKRYGVYSDGKWFSAESWRQ
jgi:hypothetical protein